MPLCRSSVCWLAFLTVALVLPAGPSYPADNKVGGTGTIIPHDGIERIDGIPGNLIEKMFVHDGDKVKRGTPLFQIEYIQAPYEMTTVDSDLALSKKDAEFRLAAEAITVKAAEARAQRAKKDAANYKAIGPNGTAEREVSRLQAAAEQEQFNLDMERLRAQQLKFDLDSGIATAVNRRNATIANLARFTVRAPADGTVIKIHHQVGEVIQGAEPVLEFGDLSAMYVDAQIYQGDMVKVRPGMKVTVKNSAFPNLANGKVETVGRLIGTRSQLGDVMIRLDKNDPADRLVGMEVEVVIGP